MHRFLSVRKVFYWMGNLNLFHQVDCIYIYIYILLLCWKKLQWNDGIPSEVIRVPPCNKSHLRILLWISATSRVLAQSPVCSWVRALGVYLNVTQIFSSPVSTGWVSPLWCHNPSVSVPAGISAEGKPWCCILLWFNAGTTQLLTDTLTLPLTWVA